MWNRCSKRVQCLVLFFTVFFICFSVRAGTLAIVIDDVGYHSKEDTMVFAMPTSISVAIIPSAPYAKQRNEQAKQQGRDILIHLPMQPKSHIPIEKGGLTLGMSQEEVDHCVQNAKRQVSYAIGMNNHMGSAATSDQSLMDKLMVALQANHLFFLDSRTIGSSVAAKTAKKFAIPVLERHIFLDDSDDLSNVQHQFQQAIQYARKYGNAIVIGHPRKNTIAVLQSGLANLPEDIQLVSVGNLWRNEKVMSILPFNYLFSTIPAPTSQAPYHLVPGLRGVPE